MEQETLFCIKDIKKPGFESKHNLNYWKFGDYLGIGCGAHGKITDERQQKIYRTVKVKHPKGYLDKTRDHLDHLNEVEKAELPFEYMMNRLRLFSSFTLKEYQEATGLCADDILPILNNARDKTLLENEGEKWRVTQQGHRYLNDLLEMFLS